MHLTIVTPAFNEAANLEALYHRIVAAMSAAAIDWEWIVVDDHSHDATFDTIRRLGERDGRIGGLRFARNYGSHTAIACGLHHASGDAAAVLAADLQDPPETLALLVDRWRASAQVVWAVRRQRVGQTRSALGFARLYYFIMRELVGLREMPASGADFFLVDRLVIDAFRGFRERPVSVLALVTWMGYRQAFVEYDKQPRHAGQSGWSLAKKVGLVLDSVTAFSAFPIRWCSYLGAAFVLASPVVALTATALPGLVVGLSGLQLLAVGIVGEYVWRALQESRQRPAFLVEAAAGRMDTARPR